MSSLLSSLFSHASSAQRSSSLFTKPAIGTSLSGASARSSSIDAAREVDKKKMVHLVKFIHVLDYRVTLKIKRLDHEFMIRLKKMAENAKKEHISANIKKLA